MQKCEFWDWGFPPAAIYKRQKKVMQPLEISVLETYKACLTMWIVGVRYLRPEWNQDPD